MVKVKSSLQKFYGRHHDLVHNVKLNIDLFLYQFNVTNQLKCSLDYTG